MRAKKEQEALKQELQNAVERMRRTKVWQPPAGMDLEIDIAELQQRAEDSLSHHGKSGASRNNSTVGSSRNNSTMSLPRAGAGGGHSSSQHSVGAPRLVPSTGRYSTSLGLCACIKCIVTCDLGSRSQEGDGFFRGTAESTLTLRMVERFAAALENYCYMSSVRESHDYIFRV